MPLQTASSGVFPGAEISTPWSSDHVPGGEAVPFGSGKTKPPPLETWPEPTDDEPEPLDPELPDPLEPVLPEPLERAA